MTDDRRALTSNTDVIMPLLLNCYRLVSKSEQLNGKKTYQQRLISLVKQPTFSCVTLVAILQLRLRCLVADAHFRNVGETHVKIETVLLERHHLRKLIRRA